MNGKKQVPDWDRIEVQFRAGVLSLREIALANGVSHVARQEEGWGPGTCRAKIQAKADALVNKRAVTAEVNNKATTEHEVVEANAEQIARIHGNIARTSGARGPSRLLSTAGTHTGFEVCHTGYGGPRNLASMYGSTRVHKQSTELGRPTRSDTNPDSAMSAFNRLPSWSVLRSWGAVLLTLLLMLLVQHVQAHASLLSSDPADGAALDAAPGELVLRFDEPVNPLQARLVDGSGRNLQVGPPRIDGQALRVALPRELFGQRHLLV